MVKYLIGDNTQLFPAGVACFFQVAGMEETMALVHPAAYQTPEELAESESSLLFEHYHLQSSAVGTGGTHFAKLEVVPTNSLSSSVFCVDSNTDDGAIFHRTISPTHEHPFPMVRESDNHIQWPQALLKQGKSFL